MNHRPRKRFGQNFLQDQHVIERIIGLINPQRDDNLIEIGPGHGALTYPLLKRAGQLAVVEIDRDLIAKLRAADLDGLRIHEGDVLQFDFTTIDQDKPLRLVGNLPYNIGTPLLIRLLDFHEKLHDVHVMLQKEVVDRLCAPAGTRAYGRLSVLMQSLFTVQALMTVPPTAFDPPPKVQSAVARLLPRADAPGKDAVDALSNATRLAFANKRKTLRNNFRQHLSAEDLETLGIDPAARAETLTLDQFASLATQLARA